MGHVEYFILHTLLGTFITTDLSMTVSTENAPLQDFVHMENLKFSVQHIGQNVPFEFVLQDTGKSEFWCFAGYRWVAFSVETVIQGGEEA